MEKEVNVQIPLTPQERQLLIASHKQEEERISAELSEITARYNSGMSMLEEIRERRVFLENNSTVCINISSAAWIATTMGRLSVLLSSKKQSLSVPEIITALKIYSPIQTEIPEQLLKGIAQIIESHTDRFKKVVDSSGEIRYELAI